MSFTLSYVLGGANTLAFSCRLCQIVQHVSLVDDGRLFADSHHCRHCSCNTPTLDTHPHPHAHFRKKCDGYMAASSITDPSLGAVNIIHEGPEEYNNMWQKLKSIWSYVYDNYYEKVSWRLCCVHVCGWSSRFLAPLFRLSLISRLRFATYRTIYHSTTTSTPEETIFTSL